MRRLIEPPTIGPTPAQAARIRRVHDLAAEFATLPGRPLAYLETVRTQTSGYDRFRTMQYSIGTPMMAAMQALMDALVATEEGVIDTKHGVFFASDLREHGAMATRGEIVFPVRYRDGAPVYRTPAERAAGPEHKAFSVAPPLRAADDDDPWRAAS